MVVMTKKILWILKDPYPGSWIQIVWNWILRIVSKIAIKTVSRYFFFFFCFDLCYHLNGLSKSWRVGFFWGSAELLLEVLAERWAG